MKLAEMKNWLMEEESGQGMVEYGLIIVLIAVVLITSLKAIGTNLKDKFNAVADELSSVANP